MFVCRSLLVLLLVSFVSCESGCYFNRQCAYPLYSSKTPYDTVRGDVRDHPKLEGCSAVSVWSLHRHGNRNPGSGVVESTRLVALMKDDIIAAWEAGRGELCAQDIDLFRAFQWNSTIEASPSFLTGTGYDELLHLGQRIRQRHPELVEGNLTDAVYFRVTNEQRTVASAMAYRHGLLGEESDAVIDGPWDPDMVIRPYAFCERYTKEVRGEAAPVNAQIDAFQNSAPYAAVVSAVQKRLGLTRSLTADEVYHFYELCRFDRSWQPALRSPWCAAFSDEDLVVLEYRDDIRHYYRNGYASWLNPRLGRPVIKDLLDTFTAAADGAPRRVTAYFSHDTMLQMAFAALGLYKDEFTLVGDSMVPERQYRTSYIAAFSTNILAVLHRCGDSDNQTHRVQMFINEKETPLCPAGGCSWDQFLDHFQQFRDADLSFCNSTSASGPDGGGNSPGGAAAVSVPVFLLLAQVASFVLSRV
ncbi:unnamed protein product [Plutella xylostella]|uniref:Multiple inositol polyphosphate phosphatase 1 n=1 Tax=Plutella xylostella TaxID=51655 RepID=A0A8S4FCW6_PLUXY|nr:unnamed protein product [Plutella xylostella]